MACFVVSYDLRKPGKDYEPLWKRLGEWGAVRCLDSVWFIKWDTTDAKLRDDLRQHIDENDRLFVGTLSSGAWHNLQGSSGQTLVSWMAGK